MSQRNSGVLDFTNFYKRFIKNFTRIIALLNLMLQTTDNKIFSIQAIENQKNQDTLAGTDSSKVDKSIENLSIIAKWAKCKKPKLTKLKKLDLVKT